MDLLTANYAFVTIWRIEAPLPEVWEAIYHSERWPEWWRGVESVIELERGDNGGIGNKRRYTWKGVLPYRLTFDIRTTRIEHERLLEGAASGDLVGNGVWYFSHHDGVTLVRYEWRVRTTKGWMNVLVPLARPLFHWNHGKVMGWGGMGLARRLGSRLCGVGSGVA